MNIEQKMNGNNQEVIKTNEMVQEIAPVEVLSEEDKQAKIKKKRLEEIENDQRIAEIKGAISKQFENNEFGEAIITNPKILDMIAEIEYCHVEDQEMKEQMIQNWKRIVDNQYKEALQDFKEFSMIGVIYGNAGWDRFQVGEDGKTRLLNDKNLKAKASAMKRAKELGMEILGSQEPLS
ncbi:MAG: hypothetical protein WC603_01900 [Candidatus Paceibacterota bacterium]|jgi:hypothetical protein